jgi:uncharacterized protein (DUF1800 family)
MRALQPAFRLDNPQVLLQSLEPLGHLPYMWHPPNGYPDVSAAWINTNGMLYRWNLAMTLPRANEDWFEGAELDFEQLIPAEAGDTVGRLVDKTTQRLLGGTVASADREQLIFFMSDFADEEQPVDADLRAERLPSLVSLVLASPYFQWS